MNNTAPNPMFQKFDQVLGKTTPTTTAAPVSSRADEIRNLAKTTQNNATNSYGIKVGSYDSGIDNGPVDNTINTVRGSLVKTAQDYGKAVPNFVNEATRQDESTSKNPIIRTGENALGATVSGLSTVFSPISNAVKDLSDQFANSSAGEAVYKNPIMGKILDVFGGASGELDKWSQAHPEAARNLSNILTVGLSAAGEEPTTKAAKSVSTEVGNIASDVANKTKESISNKLPSIADKASDIARNSEKDTWSKPTTVAKPAYNKATEIFNKAKENGHDISETLVKSGVKSSDHIETSPTGSRVYNTMDTADKIHNDAAKMSNEMLRPALEKADASGQIPKTPVRDILNDSISNIKNNKSLTAEMKDSLIEKLDQTRASLEKKYPEGLSLTEIHDEKIVRDLNSKYSPIGDPATNLEATKNKSIADSARKMVEEKAPPEIPVKEFNAELGKQHQAANYLESLHGKMAPKSILSRIAKTTAKVTGAAMGHAAGLFGSIGGYHLGGMIESMIESVPNPVKNMLLDNLKTTNPEAFEKVSNYLNNRETSGSVAQPINNASKNTTIESKPTTFQPKSQTGKLVKQISETPNKEGGFVRTPGKISSPEDHVAANVDQLIEKASEGANLNDVMKNNDTIDYLKEMKDKVLGKGKDSKLSDAEKRLFNITADGLKMPELKMNLKKSSFVQDSKTGRMKGSSKKA